MAGLLGLHPVWAVVIVIIVLVLFGVGRLPGVGGALGRGIRDFRQNLRGDESDQANPPSDKTKR